MKKSFGFLLAGLVSLPAIIWGASISGVVGASIPGATVVSAIPGATVVLTSYASGSAALIGSVTTDAIGYYSFTNVPSGLVTVSASAAGYTPSTSTASLAVNGDTAGVLYDFTLTGSVGANFPGNSTIGGLITRAGNLVGGAKVVLRRRATSNGAWVLVDSTVTSVNGFYQFVNILGAGTGEPSNAYSLIVSQPGYAVLTSTTAITVATGATTASDVALTTAAGIQQGLSHDSQNLRLTVMGDRLSLELPVSNVARRVQVIGFDGSLKRQVSIPAGESRAIVPATFAHGYLFQVK